MNDIDDHAPECDVAIWLERAIETDAPRWLGVPDDVACQCQKLRACEQRVRVNERDWRDQAFGIGYAAALDAAREAVAALPKMNLSRGVIATDVLSPLYVVNRDQALAAIDTLREERSGNPDTSPSAEEGEQA